jgi:hypothetical protein
MLAWLEVLAPLVLLALLVAVLVVWARRFGRAVAEARDVALFRRMVAEEVALLDLALGPVCTAVAALRRGEGEPAPVVQELIGGRDAVEAILGRLREARVPPGVAEWERLVGEIERVGRAMAMVEHGCTLLQSGRSRHLGEAQTAIARGYLNLIHARRAIGDCAAAIAEPRPPQVPWLRRSADGRR